MHLRLVEPRLSRPVTLLLSDAKGELYENVINGTPVAEELDAVARGDFLLILVDGAEVDDDMRRSAALHRARLLLGGLLDRDGFPNGRPVGLVLSRADLARPSARRWWAAEAKKLQKLAEDQGCPTIVAQVAARPETDPDFSAGLDEVFSGVVDDSQVRTGLRLAAGMGADASRFLALLLRTGGLMSPAPQRNVLLAGLPGTGKRRAS